MRRWIRILALLAVGMAAGIGLGLYLGWVVWPTEFTDAAPELLQESFRRDYVRMTAAAYGLDGDLVTAQRRIDDLGATGEAFVLSVTLDAILRGEDEAEIRQLARLATDLGLESPALLPYVSPVETPNAGNTP